MLPRVDCGESFVPSSEVSGGSTSSDLGVLILLAVEGDWLRVLSVSIASDACVCTSKPAVRWCYSIVRRTSSLDEFNSKYLGNLVLPPIKIDV
jgi:hypothetical protein